MLAIFDYSCQKLDAPPTNRWCTSQGHIHVNQPILYQNETETASSDLAVRSTELADQHWHRAQSAALAESEGIDLSDAHWEVIAFMRELYLRQGPPINARTTARALNNNFSGQGGSKYLRALFSGGPVTQGSRIANLRTPAYAIDPWFGTSY
jgi:tRNA 2-thiouridine synthesizing protein E